jgi:hypothetical protein
VARKVFKFPRGVCSCLLENSSGEAQRATVIKVNTRGAVVKYVPGLKETECLSATLELTRGPSLQLLVQVLRIGEEGIVLRWLHNTTQDAKQFERTLLEYVKESQGDEALGKHAELIRVDMGTAIRSRALTVNASELAARHEKLQVLDMRTINDLIQAAVEEALEVLNRPLAEHERCCLLKEAEDGFKKQVQEFREQKRDIQAHAWKLQAQLEQAQAQLRAEKDKVVDVDRFVVSDAGMLEMDNRLTRLLDRAVKSGHLSPELEEDMRRKISHLLDTEREKVSEREKHAQTDRITVLERKIGRLAKNLENSELERNKAQKWAKTLEKMGGGIRGVMKAGLDGADPNRERKLLLLKEIFDFNKEMRENLVGRGVVFTKRELTDGDGADTPAPESDTPVAETETQTETDTPVTETERQTTASAEIAPAPVVEEGHEFAEDLMDPDDTPWQAPTSQTVAEEGFTDAGIKRIVAKATKPPPLEKANK